MSFLQVWVIVHFDFHWLKDAQRHALRDKPIADKCLSATDVANPIIPTAITNPVP